ncbi:MAG: DotD/TraH family lipoprotein [Burkholderiaceae bacterium]|nr:DotD/TraH family lipoprotein [Burkholderiaceae bacterium]
MYRTLTPLYLVLLAGCASAPKPETPAPTAMIDQQILEAASKIQAAQSELYRAGALNQAVAVPATAVAGQAAGITLSWKGDALTLLVKLAAERGMDFSPLGTHLPLPVVVNVSGASFEQVISQLRSQVGYRATIELSDNVMRLQYNRPRN